MPTELDFLTFDPQDYLGHPSCERSSVFQVPSPKLLSNADDEGNLSYVEIITYVPSRDESTILIKHYLDTVEKTHPLFHVPTLHQEINDFWSVQHPVEYDWLAQFFMILAVGYRTSSRHTQHKLGMSRTASQSPLRNFLFAAEACLKKARYLLTAKNTIIRALCLMTIVTQTNGYCCGNFDACGPWLDTAVCHCMRLGYPSACSQHSDMSDLDTNVGRRIWITVAYLQVQTAINSGTPLMLQRSDFENPPFSDFDHQRLNSHSPLHADLALQISPDTTRMEGIYQVLLAKSLHAAVDIVSRANFPVGKEGLKCEDVLRYNELFRTLLRMTDRVYRHTNPAGNEQHSWSTYQRILLETFFRRALLILHQVFGRQPEEHGIAALENESPSSLSVSSHWSLLECSLAILVTQRQMLEDAPDDGPSSTTRQFYEELLKQDFFIAALHAGIRIDSEQRYHNTEHVFESSVGMKGIPCEVKDNAVSTPRIKLTDPISPKIAPRQTIIETIQCCQAIWARSLDGKSKKTCNVPVYLCLQKLIDLLNKAPGRLAV